MKNPLDYNHKGYIDLHIHSNVSDGTFSPYEILDKASSLGLKAISITDHDTIEGSRIALESGIPKGMSFISGVEVSAHPPKEFNIYGSIHLLGYGVDPYDDNFSTYLNSLRIARIDRAKKIIGKLASIGIILSENEIFNKVGDSIIGRPHFANILVKKGFSSSFKDAFDQFLGRGKPAYVEKKKVKVYDIISYIKHARGVAILAHPYLIGIKNVNVFRKFVIVLKSMGLDGLEAFHPEHPKHVSDFYLSLALSNKLLVTGGTDFHGDNTAGLDLGIGKGDFFVPFSIYQNLVKAINGIS